MPTNRLESHSLIKTIIAHMKRININHVYEQGKHSENSYYYTAAFYIGPKALKLVQHTCIYML